MTQHLSKAAVGLTSVGLIAGLGLVTAAQAAAAPVVSAHIEFAANAAVTPGWTVDFPVGAGQWKVPKNVIAIEALATGGGGGGGGGNSDPETGANGGSGALVRSRIAVKPGQVLKVWVGGAGGGGVASPGATGNGGGGGGATAIDRSGSSLVVAGGGGGGGAAARFSNSPDKSGGNAGVSNGSRGSGSAPGQGGADAIGGYSGGGYAQPGGSSTHGAGGAGAADGAASGAAGGFGSGSGQGGNGAFAAGGGGGGYGGGGGGQNESGGGGGGSLGQSGAVFGLAGNGGIGAAPQGAGTSGGAGSLRITVTEMLQTPVKSCATPRLIKQDRWGASFRLAKAKCRTTVGNKIRVTGVTTPNYWDNSDYRLSRSRNGKTTLYVRGCGTREWNKQLDLTVSYRFAGSSGYPAYTQKHRFSSCHF